MRLPLSPLEEVRTTRRAWAASVRLAAVILLVAAWGVPARPARAEASGALGRFAAAMARLDFGAAHDALCDEDRKALTREAFVTRYRQLARAPFFAAVLRSARVEEGRLTAIDWREARLLRAGLARAEPAASPFGQLPRRAYRAASVAGGVSLELARRVSEEEVAAAASSETEVTVGNADADWFGRYAGLRARCPRGVDFVIARVRGEGVDVEVGVPCGGRALDDLLLDVAVDSRAWKGRKLSAQVLLAAPSSELDPFAAPTPSLALHPAAPLR